MTNAKPIFIAIEGGEGAGKSTQTRLLLERMTGHGMPTVLVHEPGTTALGHHLRDYLKSQQRIGREAELLLFEASRAQLMEEIIRPSLNRGVSIIADRFAASSISYQGYGRNAGEKSVRMLNDYATRGLYPDLNILLDIEPGTGLGRTRAPQLALLEANPDNGARQDTEGTRRFEEKPKTFHQRVRRGYLMQVSREPARWRVIDAAQGLDRIQQEIWETVRELIEKRAGKND